jgi:LEA14-like dessication related protein
MNGRRLYLWVFLVVLAGCAPKHFVQPQLSLVGIDIKDLSLFQQRFEVRLHVHNPNDYPLPVKSMEGSFELEGEPLGTGTSNTPFTVPALGDAEFAVDVLTSLAPSLIRVIDKLNRGENSVAYHAKGTLVTSVPFVGPFPFDTTGTLQLR